MLSSMWKLADDEPWSSNSPCTLSFTDSVTFPAMFVATQIYIPLSETWVSLIFIDPEGRKVCLEKEEADKQYKHVWKGD